MIDQETYQKGLKVLKKMTGSKFDDVRTAFLDADPEFEKYVVGFLAGEIWSRPHLDLKTRSLCTIAALTALGRESALNLNIQMALVNGASKEEIKEVMFQMAPYAGFPACWEGLQAANRIFEGIGGSIQKGMK